VSTVTRVSQDFSKAQGSLRVGLQPPLRSVHRFQRRLIWFSN